MVNQEGFANKAPEALSMLQDRSISLSHNQLSSGGWETSLNLILVVQSDPPPTRFSICIHTYCNDDLLFSSPPPPARCVSLGVDYFTAFGERQRVDKFASATGRLSLRWVGLGWAGAAYRDWAESAEAAASSRPW